jgi:drug/metabolite transporter (DMT)-like permease
MTVLRTTSGLAAIAAAISSIANGAQLAATRLVVQQHDPLAFALLRYAIASACLAPLLYKLRWPSARDCALILGLGAVVAGICPWLLTISMRYTTASRGALLICTSPLLTLLFASLLGYEKCTARRIIGSCCALLGVTIGLSDQLSGTSSLINRGDAIALSTTVLLALFNVGAGRMMARHRAITVVPLASLGGLTILFGFAIADDTLRTIATFTPSDWAAIVFSGTIGGAGVLLLWTWAIERASAGRIAVFVTAAPMSAAIAGAMILSEPITPQLVAGTALIIAGVYLVYRPAPVAVTPAAAPECSPLLPPQSARRARPRSQLAGNSG